MAATLQPDTAIDHFVILSVIGEGGFGVTYRAEDMNTGGIVAIKENYPSYLASRDENGGVVVQPYNRNEFDWTIKNFVKEARILAQMSHPGVVKVHRAFEVNGTAYFAMEYLDATPLSRYVAPEYQWDEESLKSLLSHLLDALTHIHRNGVYHRDIKPANIMIRNDSQTPVLIDFGAAKLESALGTNSRGFESKGYSAPEQLSDDAQIGAWTDVYALGATVYHLLTGQPPSNAAARIYRDDFVPLAGGRLESAGFSRSFLTSVDKALSLRVDVRFKSAEEWKRELQGGRDFFSSPEPRSKKSGSASVASSNSHSRSEKVAFSGKQRRASSHGKKSSSSAHEKSRKGIVCSTNDQLAIAAMNMGGRWMMIIGFGLLMFQVLMLADDTGGGMDFLFPVALAVFIIGLCLWATHRFFLSGGGDGSS